MNYVQVAARLPEKEAYALAEMCKRISFAQARELAVDEAETYAIIRATDNLRSALEEAGVSVR